MSARIDTPWVRLDPETLWTERDGRRFYRLPGDPHDRVLPAVSTVLEETIPNRFALDAWERSLGAQNAEIVRQVAIERGRKLHAKIKGLLLDHVEPQRDVWWDSIENTVRHLASAGRTLLCEGAVLNLRGGYAGTPDDVVAIAGRLYVVDWKTAAEPRGEQILDEYEAQLGGYVDGIEAHYGVRPTHGLIVVALPDRRAQVHSVPVDRAVTLWRDRLAAFYS